MLKILDLFSGLGGFSLGLERCRIATRQAFETVAFCEIEPFCHKVLRKHWPDVPIYEDIRKLTMDRLSSDGIFPDIVTGSFPCQDLSRAGKLKGINGERTNLYKEYLRILGDGRFRYAIFENVTDLLIQDKGRWFARFLYDLATIGYDAEWHCLPASEFGAAHHRDRVWVIAYPNGTNVEGLDFSKPLFPDPEESRRRQFTRAINATLPADDYVRVRENFDDVPGEMDRLKGYGNAVVPLIPQFIGYAILNAAKKGESI